MGRLLAAGVSSTSSMNALESFQGRATCSKEGRGSAERIILTPSQTLAVGRTNYRPFVTVMRSGRRCSMRECGRWSCAEVGFNGSLGSRLFSS